MKIETKFNMRDIVYHLKGSIQESKVRRVNVQVIGPGNLNHPDDVRINYELYDDFQVPEKDLYSTKEEAGIAWLKAQGLDCGLKGN